jgi:hypothetical protein
MSLGGPLLAVTPLGCTRNGAPGSDTKSAPEQVSRRYRTVFRTERDAIILLAFGIGAASQVLQDDRRGKVKGDQRRGLDGEIAPDPCRHTRRKVSISRLRSVNAAEPSPTQTRHPGIPAGRTRGQRDLPPGSLRATGRHRPRRCEADGHIEIFWPTPP